MNSKLMSQRLSIECSFKLTKYRRLLVSLANLPVKGALSIEFSSILMRYQRLLVSLEQILVKLEQILVRLANLLVKEALQCSNNHEISAFTRE
ncbi:hypothetical protein [Peribacillus frigoritolerans]|uniref:hypothetical protein n=1 Tax=Peribacillus frigoritolerans TaxID=450367 RepID=UPI00207A6819|nr:hypothetical protein [Peribacillus frigoritolerans]USK73882.1 hypothetical protein LIT31_18950 [Peribacillus frigoritolerans]